MRFPLLFIPIAILMLMLFSKIRKSNVLQQDKYSQFLRDEREANFSRRNDPAPEDFLTVDASKLPIREYPNEQAYQRVISRQRDSLELAKAPMIYINRHMNNRELKMKYGTANLDTIIMYEENYNRFIHSLLEWGAALISTKEFDDDAVVVLNMAIDYHCDRSQVYTMLADIFAKRHESAELDKLRSLLEESDTLNAEAKTKALTHIDRLRGQV